MNGIISMAELLRSSPLSPEQRKSAEIIRQSGEALMALLNDILDLSKIEARKIELRYLPFDLSTLLMQTVNVLAAEAFERGLELMVDLEPTLSLSLLGVPSRLRQILLNLLTNALKFTGQGEASLKVRTLSADGASLRLRFEVQDTGIGIPSDQLEMVFLPFKQGDESVTRQYSGTGLGLAISRQLVQLMKGEIGVRSEPGQGSCFWFDLPFEVLSETKVRSAEVLPGHSLLWLSPPSQLSSDVAQALEQVGLEVYCWAGVESKPPPKPVDLVLVNWAVRETMPDLQWVQRWHPKARYVLLAYPEQERNLSPELRQLFSAWLPKPVLVPELLQIITETLGGPQASQMPEIDPPVPVQADKKYSARILVAEDNAINQVVAEAVLSRLGHEVDLVQNGREALDALRQKRYDLVLMDCQMPELDGYEVTRLIRQKGSGVRSPQVPIIALTAYALQGDRERCQAAGMDDYLTKPFTPEQMEQILNRWLARL